MSTADKDLAAPVFMWQVLERQKELSAFMHLTASWKVVSQNMNPRPHPRAHNTPQIQMKEPLDPHTGTLEDRTGTTTF